jgi:hypothetical protein
MARGKAKGAAVPAIDLALVNAADELGQVRAALEPLKARERAAMDIILGAGLDEIQGRGYTARVQTSTRATVDVAALRRRCGQDFVQENTSMSTVRSIRVSARADVISEHLKLAA